MEDFLEEMNGPSTLWGKIGEVPVLVHYKAVKHMTMRMRADKPWLEVSAPYGMPKTRILKFLQEHQDWMEKARSRLDAKVQPTPLRYYESGDTLQVWGQPVTLQVHTEPTLATKDGRLHGWIQRDGDTLHLTLSQASDAADRRELLEQWYRGQLEQALPAVFARCEPIVGKHASSWHTRRMKSRWGSCNTATGRICINTQLARLDPRYLEYVVIHELTHLWVHNHGAQFQAHMDRYCPDWRERRKALNEHAPELG